MGKRCITPITIKNSKTGNLQEVPCSNCWLCLTRRADGWAFRILQEKKRSASAHFVTLTYSDKHVPINKHYQLTLERKEIPKYIKRLRKLQNKALKIMPKPNPYWDKETKKYKAIKYYAVGEYGEEIERPHYHIIIFNAIKELIPLAWNKRWKYWDSEGYETEINDMLGIVQIGDKGVTAGGARYLAQYMLTGQNQNNEYREKPFSLMSKGMGLNYITNDIRKWHLQPTGSPIVLPNGKIIQTRDRYYTMNEGFKISLPRYFRDKIFPKIYREIDIPIIVNKFNEKEYKEISKNFLEHQNNREGLIETNKSIMIKKAKEKKRKRMEIPQNTASGGVLA